jgi:TonB family protein
MGGGVYRPGNGITSPQILHEVKPGYTAGALRVRIQGAVEMEAVVMPDGSVGPVRITRSLDPVFGLDQEAITAVKQWRFRPGLRRGQAVPVLVVIEMTFTLR